MADIDIEVKQGALETYHNYPYKIPQVFGEFIDNAIQSFEDNKIILTATPGYKLRVDITIEWATSADNEVRANVITIEDNSAGMTAEKFADAFKSADRSTPRTGMNEFGMGMKVAVCWLGKKWRVETKSIAEIETHILDIDVEKVSRENIKSLPSKNIVEPSRMHGTKIIINDMWPQTQIKKSSEDYLIRGIASIYRYFIRRGEIEISVNDQILTFEKYEVLKAAPYTNPDGPEVEWTSNVTMQMGRYGVSGFVSLLKDMDEEKRGVVIMRNHRVVMGFDPADRTIGKSLMGQFGSKKYRRVFGELEVTGFEVAFGKNQVIDLDQLEALMKAVAGKLKVNGVNLLTQCDKYTKKPKKTVPTPSSSQSASSTSSSSTTSSTPSAGHSSVPSSIPTLFPLPETTSTSHQPSTFSGSTFSGGGVSEPSATFPTNSIFPKDGKFKLGSVDYMIKMLEGTESPELFWNDYSKMGDNILLCKVNLQHSFFQVFGKPTKALLAIIKALSIAKFKSTKEDNSASAMMNDFNQFIFSQAAQD